MTPSDPERLLVEGANLRALARDLVAGAADVDDLVQETWLRALMKPPREGFSLRAWLAGLARNVAHERRRAERRRGELELRASDAHGASVPPTDDPADVVARFELVRRVFAFVDELAEPQRTTLLRRYLDGLEPAEIARREGLPDATVRSRVKRGLDELRARLDAASGGDRNKWMALLVPWSRPAATVAAGAATTLVGGLLMKTSTVMVAAALAVAALVLSAVLARQRTPAAASASRTGHATPSPAAAPTAPPERAATPQRIPDGDASNGAFASAPDGAPAPAPDGEWRLEGVLHGLEPAIPWTGTIRVSAAATSLDLKDMPVFSAKLEDGGRFEAELPGLAPRPGVSSHWRVLKVEAVDPAYSDVATHVDVLDTLGGPRAGPFTFHVALDTKPSARVHGRVVDEAGRPVEGAIVAWQESVPQNGEGFAKSDAAGGFRLEAGSPGAAPLYCWGAQYGSDEKAAAAAAAIDDFLPAIATVAPRAGVDLPVPDFVLRRGARIRGIVVDADGDAVAGARLSASPVAPPSETPSFMLERRTASGADGSFELTGLLVGRWRIGVVGSRDLPSHPVVGDDPISAATESDAPSDQVEIVSRLCRVEVWLHLDGQPLVHSPITVMGTSKDGNESDLGGTTSADGRFQFTALPGCKYQVSVDHPDVESETPPFVLADDETERVVHLDLVHRRPRATLAMKLHDPAGRSVARAWFRVKPIAPPEAGASEFTLDSDDGTFLLKELEPGDFRVVVRAGGGPFGGGGFFQEEAVDVVIASPDTAEGRDDRAVPRRIERSVDLRPTGRLRVAAVDAAGNGMMSHCTLSTQDGRRLDVGFTYEAADHATGSDYLPLTLEEPAFVNPPPPPGRYRLEFTADGCVAQTVDTEVVTGRTTDVVVTLARR
jgi:RNA polymerase sigma factor (sigma-70 family)